MKKIFLMLSLLSCQNTLLNTNYKGGGEIIDIAREKEELMKAAKEGDLTSLTNILKGEEDWIILDGNSDVAEISIIDLKDESGFTALMHAANNGHDSSVEELLNNGASATIGNISGETPIVLSVKNNHLKCLKLLTDKIEGSNGEKENMISTLLCVAVDNRSKDCAKYLINQEANFISLLFSRIDSNEIDEFSFLIRCLIELEIDISDIQNRVGYTLLSYVITKEDRDDFITFLINCEEYDIESTDSNGWTALMHAVSCNKMNYLTKLIKADADIDAWDEDRCTSLNYSVIENKREMVTFLLDNKANPDYEDKEGNKPLQYAIEKGFYDIAKLLLDKKALPNCENKDKKTPLIVVAERLDKEGIELLLNHKGKGIFKTNVNCCDKNRKTPLMYVAENGDEECFRLFINHKDIRISMTNVEEGTALMCAAANGNSGCLEMLLEAKVEKDCKDLYGNTPLILAANNGSVECVNLLLKHYKENIDSTNKRGYTALMHAAEGGHKECVKALVEAGANKDIKNDYDKDALSLAKDNCKELLK